MNAAFYDPSLILSYYRGEKNLNGLPFCCNINMNQCGSSSFPLLERKGQGWSNLVSIGYRFINYIYGFNPPVISMISFVENS